MKPDVTTELLDTRVLADPLPTRDLLTDEEIRTRFVRLSVTPFGDASLAFELLVPSDWRSRDVEVTREQLARNDQASVPMAEIGPDDPTIAIQVQQLRVPARATLARVVEVLAEAAGLTIVARQPGEFGGRLVEDALLRRAGDAPTLTRLTALRRGELVLFVGSTCPERRYPALGKLFGAAAVSFAPLAKG